MKTVNPRVEVLGLYEKREGKLPVKCKICGYEWSPTAGSLLSGHGCPKCVGKARISHDEFIRLMEQENPKVKILGAYQNKNTPVLVKCKTCGYEWNAIPKTLLNGSGCRKCANINMISHKPKNEIEFIKELSIKEPTIEPLSAYKKAHEKIKIRCRVCGYEWFSTPHNLLSGYGCPICVLAGTSRVERFIYECFCLILGEENVLFRNKSTGIELDIYIPSIKCAIEYGAWYWHKDKIENDREKRRICSEKGIRLLTIYDSITEPAPFDTDCYCFSKALSINSLSTLANLVIKLFDEIGIDISSRINFGQIKTKVILTSGVDKQSKFVYTITETNPSIEVIGDYISANTPIKVKCKKCGYEWNAIPSNLKKGSGCPRCKGIAKRTNREFLLELSKISNKLEPLEEYAGANTKILIRCKECGREWTATPHTLLRGNGCRRCSRIQKDK